MALQYSHWSHTPGGHKHPQWGDCHSESPPCHMAVSQRARGWHYMKNLWERLLQFIFIFAIISNINYSLCIIQLLTMTPKRNDIPLGGSECVMLCLDSWNLAWYVVPRILSYNQNQLLAASTPLAMQETLPPVHQGEDRTKEGGSCENHMFKWIPFHSQWHSLPTASWPYHH